MNKKIIAYIQEKGVLSNTPLFYLSNIFYSISLYFFNQNIVIRVAITRFL